MQTQTNINTESGPNKQQNMHSMLTENSYSLV